jgi:hypothetical protein
VGGGEEGKEGGEGEGELHVGDDPFVNVVDCSQSWARNCYKASGL